MTGKEKKRRIIGFDYNDPKECLERVKNDGFCLKYIANQTEEMCIAAVRNDGRALACVKKQNPRICLEAVKQHPVAICHVNDEFLYLFDDGIDNKKYEFTGTEIPYYYYGKCHILQEIRALKDFDNVKAGDIGGYIESEENLSHEGNCWVKGIVFGDSKVLDNAKVYGIAINTTVSENAMICRGCTVIYSSLSGSSRVTR